VIPAKANRRRPAPHDREKYRWRNLIERLFNKLKNWRRVATRYDKATESYLGFVTLASSKLWIPFVHET
jgi:transposase